MIARPFARRFRFVIAQWMIARLHQERIGVFIRQLFQPERLKVGEEGRGVGVEARFLRVLAHRAPREDGHRQMILALPRTRRSKKDGEKFFFTSSASATHASPRRKKRALGDAVLEVEMS